MAVRQEEAPEKTYPKLELQPSPVAPPVSESKRSPHHQKFIAGCYICRRRRAECDKEKPVCRTCTVEGYTCAGHARSNPTQLVPVPRASNLRGRNEHQAFQFFMEKTMTWFDHKDGPCIDESHINEFWNPIILQMTQSEPAIKHILLAWAELHRRILYESIPSNEPFENEFFWQNHCQALRLLGSTKKIDMSVMLIACIMFCILENFRGRRDIFLKHLHSGMHILSSYDQTSADLRRSICDTIITRYIRPLLLAFHLNLSNIVEFELLHPKEKLSERLIKLRQAGRVIKSWN